ncbi:MAG: leucyl aminopeptidase [Candidatus Eremiobacteraeota bacterium]|nr:leucyl aminopeptidase [Candidatus Eremiobacteraeota bacterium]
MQVRIAKDTPSSLHVGALVVPVFSDSPLEGVAKTVDAELKGAIADVFPSGEHKGKPYELSLIHAKDYAARRILIVGLGESKKFEPYMLARYAGAAVRYLGRRGISEIAFALPQQAKGNESASASFIAEGAATGAFEINTYNSEPEKVIKIDTIAILADGFDSGELETGAARGQILGEAINYTRTMALTPANDMTPTHMADRAQDVAKQTGIELDVLDEARARQEGMGSFLSVAQGSAQPPKFIVMTYKGDPGSTETLALVGKGITFDSGGISIKPADRMEEMKYDMSGGAGVIGAMLAIGKLKPKLNIIGIVPATENMPGGKATKPGDIVKAMNGTTIEVINTDAEGRLVLADALCYANKLGATKIIDAATLTGAVVIALGHAASAAVSNDEGFVQQFLKAAEPTGERYWRMPLYDDYSTAMKSDVADLKNTGGRPGGTLTASAFLKSFVGSTPWIHLDVAGTAYLDTESAWQAKGPTGTPVRAFVALVEQLAGSQAHVNGKVPA